MHILSQTKIVDRPIVTKHCLSPAAVLQSSCGGQRLNLQPFDIL